MIRFITFPLILLICSCTVSTGPKDTDINEIEVGLSINIDNAKTKQINLSELTEDFRIVNLETKNDALLNTPTGFAVTEKYLLIVDIGQNPAKLFTTDGKYLREIGNIGSGPDEYMSVVSPYIDKTDHSLFLLVGGNYFSPKEGWFYIYNNSGEIINRINTRDKSDEQNANRVLIHDNMAIRPGNVNSRDIISIKSFKDEKEFKIKNRIPKDYFTYTTNTSIVYPFNGDYHFKIGESDTIYSLSADKIITPIATVFTRKFRFDAQKIKDARSTRGSGRFENILAATEGCYSIKLLGETNRYYLLSVLINGKEQSTKLLTIDKDSGEPSFTKIINDYLFDIKIDKEPFIYNNEYMILHYPAVNYLKVLKSKQEETDNQDIINNINKITESIDPESNDILLISKIKL